MTTPLEFAVDVVRKLRAAGYDALFAGGCVRDRVLGIEPSDYDVATSARPTDIQAVFGKRKTLAVGAAFGVIAVVGPKSAGTVEVATFRRDLGYTDGRRPDGVEFCDAEEDARRRDFTINGMFYDPLTERVIDYVGGEADLREGVLRAIGDPDARFNEDKLRLLRAVRFASRFGFGLEAATERAVIEMAARVVDVSVERIADELRKMLSPPSRTAAIAMLRHVGLIFSVFPEWADALQHPTAESAWQAMLDESRLLETSDFVLALAILLAPLPHCLELDPEKSIRAIGRRLKLSNDEIAAMAWLVKQQDALAAGQTRPWSEIQPLLIQRAAPLLIAWTRARAIRLGRSTEAADWCATRLEWPPERLDPPPLLTGDDLIRDGWNAGPAFSKLLSELRAAQLDDILRTPDEARAWVGEKLGKS